MAHDVPYCKLGTKRQFFTRTMAAAADYRSPESFEVSPLHAADAPTECDQACSWWVLTCYARAKQRLVTDGDDDPIQPLTETQITQTTPAASPGPPATVGFSEALDATVLKAQITLTDGTGTSFRRRVDIGRGWALWWYGASARIEVGHAPSAELRAGDPITYDVTARGLDRTDWFDASTGDYFEDTMVYANIRATKNAPPPGHARTPLIWTYVTYDPGPESTEDFHFAPPGARRASLYQDNPGPSSGTWKIFPAPLPGPSMPIPFVTAPVIGTPRQNSMAVPGQAFGMGTLAVGKSVSVWEIEL